ncbi:MAG: rhodanese-like domain-containing protein [Thermoleophilaceae bacterium]
MSSERELTPDRVSELLGAGELELVDVRTPEEHGAGHVAGARHVPLERLSEAAGQLDDSKTLVFYCRSGERSAAAAEALVASGREAYSMSGGLLAWHEQGLPLEPDGGEVIELSGLPPA